MGGLYYLPRPPACRQRGRQDDLIQYRWVFLGGKPFPWHHQAHSQLSPASPSNPPPQCRRGELPAPWVLETQGHSALPVSTRRHTTRFFPACCGSMEQGTPRASARLWALPLFLQSLLGPSSQSHWKRGRQEGTDRWTRTGCGKTPSTGRQREARAPLHAGGSGPLGAGSGSLQSCPIALGQE